VGEGQDDLCWRDSVRGNYATISRLKDDAPWTEIIIT
jgi:hypothetical protein